MKKSQAFLISIALSMLLAAGYVLAQEDEEHESHHPEQQDAKAPDDRGGVGPKPGGMMGGGMMGSGMMGCKMMQGGTRGGMMDGGMMERVVYIPQLPPGNARLQFMMQAEILQKVGEVEAKYAAQIKEPSPN